MDNWQKAKTDEQFRRQLLVREDVIDGIRIFFKQQQFREVETPLFVPSPDSEPTIEPFATRLELADSGGIDGYLTTSPEFAMKKLLAGNFGSIFQICKAFRNGEPPSSRHNSEFTILEWYRVESDYKQIMQDCEALLLFILRYVQARAAGVSPLTSANLPAVTTLHFQGKDYDLAAPWERLTVLQAFNKYAEIDEQSFFDRKLLGQRALVKGYQVAETDSLLDLQTQILAAEIEPHLGHAKPTILYDYPAAQAALSRKKASDPRFAERFEIYLAGIELGNAFSELADPIEQEQRLRQQQRERQQAGQRHWEPDAALLEALREGIPPTGGIAIGVDRLVMLFADAAEIQDVLLFPQREWLE